MSAVSAKAWRQANPERYATKNAQWRAEHPEAVIAMRRRANQKRYQTFRARLNEIKLAAGCTDCGYDAHPAALDFDHVVGVKKFGISATLNGHTWADIKEEISKCVVRCANCHRVRTWENRSRCLEDGPS